MTRYQQRLILSRYCRDSWLRDREGEWEFISDWRYWLAGALFVVMVLSKLAR